MRRNQVIILIVCIIASILSCSNPKGDSNNKKSNEVKVITNDTIAEVDTVNDTTIVTEPSVDLKGNNSIIIYYKMENNNFTYYMDEYPEIKTTKLAVFNEYPLDVIFKKGPSVVYFVTTSGIFSCDYKSESKNLIKLADLPNTSELDYTFLETWIDSNTEKITMAYKISVGDNDEKLKDKIKKIDKNFEFNNYAEIIRIFQLTNENKWKTVIEKVVEFNPYGSSLSMVSENVKKSSKYLTSGDIAKSFAYAGCEKTRLLSDAEAKKILKENTLDENAAISIFKLNDKTNLITTINWGDTPHFVPPLYLQEIASGELIKIDAITDSNKQLGIQFSKNHLIISDEYSSDNALVYNRSNMKLIKSYKGCFMVIEIE